MLMQGRRQLNASTEQAWQALNEPEILKQCIPGCQSFEEVSPNTYNTTATIKIGPVSDKVRGRVELTDIQPPRAYSLNFSAQGDMVGHVKGTLHVELIENNHGVELQYSVQSQIGGKLADVEQHLVDSAAKSMADDFFKRFEQALQAQIAPAGLGEPSDPAHPDPTPPTAVTTAESAPISSNRNTRFPQWLWIAIAVSIIMILIVI